MPKITDTDLQKSAQKFRKELLLVPVIAAGATLKHFTPHLDLAGDLVLGEMTGNVELGPYKSTRGSEDADISIVARKLEIFLGNCAEKFKPNNVWGTIWGSKVMRGKSLENVDINKTILSFAAAKIGKKLNMAIWSASHNPSGDTTKEMFNGLDTITTSEISKSNVSVEKKNYKEVPKITALNAVEVIESIMDDLSPELISSPCKLFASPDIVRNYERDFRERFTSAPYNNEYNKKCVEGTAGMVELVPLASKAGSQFIHICPETNVHYGCGGGSFPDETIGIGKYSSWVLTLEAAMAFGVQFESLAPELFFAAKVATV